MRDLLFNRSYRPLDYREYHDYRTYRQRNQTYYGRDTATQTPKYGTSGSATQEHYSGSTFAKGGGFKDSKYASKAGGYRDSQYSTPMARDPNADHSPRKFGSGSSQRTAPHHRRHAPTGPRRHLIAPPRRGVRDEALEAREEDRIWLTIMNMRVSAAVLLGTLLAFGVLRAESTPAKALLVLAKSDNTLAIVDPASLKVVARMPSGPDPHEVVASSDGKFAYISNYGGGAYNTLTVIDLVAQKALPAVDLGALRGPHGLVFAGGKVWFTAEAAKVIGSYDPATQKVDWVLGTGQNRTHMIFVSDDLKRMITSNVSSATMTIIEKSVGGRGRGPGSGRGPDPGRGPAPGRGGPGGAPQGDWDETVVAVGRGAEGFDVSPDGKELWAANAQDGTISILDLAGKKSAFSGLKLLHVKRHLQILLSLIGRNGVFDEYTLHDISHIDAMLRSLDWIIPDGTKAVMTAADWLISVLGVYFHDLGMLVTREEFDQRSSTTFPSFVDRILYEGDRGTDV